MGSGGGARTGAASPVIDARSDAEGRRRAKRVFNRRVSASADVKAPAGQTRAVGAAEEKLGAALRQRRTARRQRLDEPAVRRPKMLDRLKTLPRHQSE